MSSYTDGKGAAHQISENDEIFISAAALLTNDGAAGQVGWTSTLPDKQCETADHQLATPTQRAVIRIGMVEKCSQKAGQPLNFETLWHELFFELFNIQNDAGFLELFQDATKGKYSECEYTVESTKLEYYAEVKLSNFYKNIFAPWADAHGLSTDEWYWVGSIKPTYEEWIAQYKDPGSYPWDYWGNYFYQNIVPYLNRASIPVPARACKELHLSTAAEPTSTAVVRAAAAANERGNSYWKQKDYIHAFIEYQQACAWGNMSGCSGLGLMHAAGLGAAQDFGKASQLYKQACDGGEMQGCELLGNLYKNGNGVGKDLNRARELFIHACKGGFNQGCVDRDELNKP